MTELYVNANSFPASRPRQVLLAKEEEQQAATPSSSTPNALITWEPTAVLTVQNGEIASWSNNGPFLNTWQRDNITFKDGIMTITLDNKGCPDSCDGKPVASGEIRSKTEGYDYGYYEASMKPTSGSGLMSGSFFTFRGTYGQASHDEIDMEFLGKDPECRTLQTNYYAAGQGHHEQIINLDFNACEEFHNYGFKWAKDSLAFYVDGKAVRNVSGGKLPSRKSKIMANLWAGTSEVAGWLGSYKDHGVRQTKFRSIKYSTLEAGEQQPVAAAKPVAPATPAAPLNELAAVKEGLIIYKFLTRKDESRQLLSKPTAENTLKQGFAFAAVAGGLSKEEESVVFNLAEMGGLNSEKNYNTSADLIALLGGIDAGTVDVPDKGTGFSGESKRKIKEALVIYDLLTFKMHTRDLLSDETRKATLPGREPELGVSMSAVQVGGGITPKLFDVVTSLGNQYLSDRIGSADLDVLLGREQEIKARLCSVAQIGCDSAAGPGKKISVTAPTPAPEENKKLKKPFMDLDKLASDVVRDIAKKFGQSKHLSDSTPTKLHVGVTGMISGSEAIFGFYLEEGGFTKTYPLPAGYSEAEVERDRAYLGKVLANKPIILSKPAD